VIYMPMVPQAVFAMLACARLGAIHSVVFGGFAAGELAARIEDCKPKVVLSASCGIEIGRLVEYKPLLDKALTIAKHAPRRCVILQRPQLRAPLVAGRDIDWDEALPARASTSACRSRQPDPLYILYTSGTRAGRRASCATTAATRSRCAGACATSTASSRARRSGPRPTSAGSSAIRTSSMRRC
jgi:propionyl-CoA synthetase